MIRRLLISFTLILASCAQVPESPHIPQPTQSQAIQETPGERVVRHLTERASDLRFNCGAASQPAFLCNGVMIRGTDHSPNYHAWDNSINNHRKGAVSFSYLRNDSKYNKLAYNYKNGFIFLPVFYANGKLTPEVLCSFPIDAGTENREGTGCGPYPGFAASGPCQNQGITTAAGWWQHYQAGNHSHSYQCGFDVRDSLDAQATAGFQATIQAMALMGNESFNTQNELRLRVWTDGLGANLPLEAFFYVHGLTGRADAMADQLDLYRTNRVGIPVIELWLPTSSGVNPQFQYHPADQTPGVPLT